MSRMIGALTGGLISGNAHHLKNVILGPLYLGRVTYKLTGSVNYSALSSIWYTWGLAQFKLWKTAGSALKRWDLICRLEQQKP